MPETISRFRGMYRHPERVLALASLSLAALLALTPASFARHHGSPDQNAHPAPRLTSDLTGSIPVRDGDHVRLSTDLGSVVIRSANDAGKVDYRVHLETDVAQKDARELLKSLTIEAHPTPDGVALRAQVSGHRSTGRLWVTLEMDVPKDVNLDASTGGGNIDSSEVDGRVNFETRGGNITTARIGGPAHLETGGGNIVVNSVAGEAVATTGGGHITIGNVAGNAILHTSGGHIRAGSIQGTARLETGGGNITLERSGGELTAETGGGEIEVGEAAGLVRAKTGGGGIRVVRLVGPTDLQTAGGSIYLTQVDSPVKASTEEGGITAWFVGPSKMAGVTDLESSQGDIVVHLPKELPVTIDASVQMRGDHHVIVDPALPLKVSYDDFSKGSSRIVRAEGDLNGGGELLRLHTVAGNIQLVLTDMDQQVEMYKQQMDRLKMQMDKVKQQLDGVKQQLAPWSAAGSGDSRGGDSQGPGR
jgi:DUF4097 and DUF4098 domain-containing protein YvlB